MIICHGRRINWRVKRVEEYINCVRTRKQEEGYKKRKEIERKDRDREKR